MKRAARWLPMLAALLLVGARKEGADDRITFHPDLERRRPSGVAILPAVAYQDLPGPEATVEVAWLAQFASSGHDWLPASMSREFLAGASRRPDSLMRLVTDQLRDKGRIDSVTARTVLRRLRRGALLWLRLDRWEREAPYEWGSTTVAHIEITATLVDSNGTLLWQASARERQEARYGIPTAEAGGPNVYKRSLGFSARDPGVESVTPTTTTHVKRPATSLEPTGADFELALRRIMARWRASFPAPPTTSSSRPAG